MQTIIITIRDKSQGLYPAKLTEFWDLAQDNQDFLADAHAGTGSHHSTNMSPSLFPC